MTTNSSDCILISDHGRIRILTMNRPEALNAIPSLIATKELMIASGRAKQALAAHQREAAAYTGLMGAPANRDAVAAFREKRAADFTRIENA